jgi:dissimilatory sulfite reductase (desulfoviridin) alpha/beta subunit
MYRYDEVDFRLVNERVAQFRDQTRRYLAGELSEDEFRPLRLMNGLYVQRHAPMLRVAVPYGMLSSRQVRKLAHIARTYDRGYGHFTTRQNLQFNWPALETVPDILAELAEVEMHAIQTSGNCIRNTTTDQFAGVAADELVDPRPYCEIIRQWSTFHPEFTYLPRKFKIAVSGAEQDRAATLVHDIGLHAVRNAEGEVGFRVIVGGGLGRTPMIGSVIREFLPAKHILTYLDAILRVYNRFGRQEFTNHAANHRRAAQAAADDHAKAHFALGIAHGVQADVVHQGGGAVLLGAGHGNLELARQVGEFRVEGAPLADDFAIRARVHQLVGGHAGKLVRGGVADAIARGLDGVHFHLGQLGQDVGHGFQRRPVELQILAGGEVAVATVVSAGNVRQLAHLARGQHAVGHRHAQHRRMALHIQAVHQPQRAEFIFAQFAGQVAAGLVAELGDPLIDQAKVNFVVTIHVASRG